MTRRIGILIGCSLAVVLALFLWQFRARREPVFEGRPLTSWLDHHVASSAADPPYGSPGWKKADVALRRIGTNAIPILLEMIAARDHPQFIRKWLEMAQRKGWTRTRYRYAVVQHEEAEYAFRMLGTNAASAVPRLIRIYEANISPSSQMSAALALGSIGEAAQAALPALIQRFTHTNRDVRFYAVSAVMQIKGDPTIVIPALTRALQDSNVHVRWNALVGLSRFGARARPVVPEIQKMLSDQGMVGTSPIKEQVEIALWRIAPEQVGEPLVVEESTPMIVNGVTTEALKVTFHGERKTLIPAGRRVPAGAQYWNSDPRPRLGLYRTTGGPEGKDHFLGEFEVVVQDLPEATDVNISTLCVIADGRIILCARDNHRDRFLRIRRVENNLVK